jgi:hypothetical protein
VEYKKPIFVVEKLASWLRGGVHRVNLHRWNWNATSV